MRWGAYYWLIDREGRKLPEQFPAASVPREVMADDDTINLRIIEGVRKPPPEVARKWAGEDLAAGIEMLGVLFNRAYTEDILKIDVSNLHGRVDSKEPQIVLTTRYNSRIYWGRLPSDKDSFIEVRPEQKLDYLKTAFEKTGRSDMKQPWIDLRFDGMRSRAPLTRRMLKSMSATNTFQDPARNLDCLIGLTWYVSAGFMIYPFRRHLPSLDCT